MMMAEIKATAKEMADLYTSLAASKKMLADILERGNNSGNMETYFNTVPMLFCISDDVGHLILHNSKWYELLGYTSEELRTTPFMDLVHPDDRHKTQQKYVGILMNDEPCYNWPNRYRTKWGSYVELRWFCRATTDRKSVICAAYLNPESDVRR